MFLNKIHYFFIKIKAYINQTLIKWYDYIHIPFSFATQKFHYDLVIVRFDRIGDFVIGMDILRGVLKAYRGKRILYVCRSFTSEIAEKSRLFTDVVTIKEFNSCDYTYNFRYHFKFAERFKKYSAELVINPTWSRIEPSDLVVHWIRSSKKYGCLGQGIGRPCAGTNDTYYTKLIGQPPFDSEFHYAQYFINNTIDPKFQAGLPQLDIIYKSEQPIVEGMYSLIGISASYEKRIWPMERMAAVIDVIPEEYNIVLMGYGDKDLERSARIISLVKKPQRIINMVNKTSMWDMFNLISNAQFVIGMDSSPVHIAAAARVRSVCIAPGAYYKRFVPYPKELGEVIYHPRTIVSDNQKCFHCAYSCSRPEMNEMEALPCLMEISVERVKKEVIKLLEEI